jgi:hypothetical protein
MEWKTEYTYLRPALVEGENVLWHRWGQQNDGDGDYLAAIIEYPHGEVKVVSADMVIFLEEHPGGEQWGLK